ncbi:MAG: hypothetical protein KDE20_17145 [Caldilineaceae bacterium]|nr:hypothetical protein [Caldilineaceae bacterium]
MKFVWMFLALVIAVGIAYLIWEEFIVKREQADDGNAERYAEADIKALFDEQRPTGHPSDTDAAAALHSAVEEAEEEIAHAHEHAPAPTEEPTETVLAEEIAATDDAAEAASVADEGEAEVVAARTTGVTTEVIEMAPDNLTKVKGIGKVYQQRLNEAGIYTFAQIAEADPAKLAEIAKAIDAANVEDWPRQARELMA